MVVELETMTETSGTSSWFRCGMTSPKQLLAAIYSPTCLSTHGSSHLR